MFYKRERIKRAICLLNRKGPGSLAGESFAFPELVMFWKYKIGRAQLPAGLWQLIRVVKT